MLCENQTVKSKVETRAMEESVFTFFIKKKKKSNLIDISKFWLKSNLVIVPFVFSELQI